MEEDDTKENRDNSTPALATGNKTNDMNDNKQGSKRAPTAYQIQVKEKIKRLASKKPTATEPQEKKRVGRRRSGPMKPKTEEPLRKGKTYRSSAGRELKEKDPNSKEVLDKKYRLDTKPGNTGSKLISRLIIYYFLMSIKLILS